MTKHRPDLVLTKSEWISALSRPIDNWAIISRAQVWLEHQFEYFSAEILSNQKFQPDTLVDFIHTQARKEAAKHRPEITYLNYISSVGIVSDQAVTFARDLVKVCRHISGDRAGDCVQSLVLADYSAIWRYTLDFLADVFTPMYPLLDLALTNVQSVRIYLDDVVVIADPLSIGRAWLWIHRETKDPGHQGDVEVTLCGGDFEPDGNGLALHAACGPSLADILQMLHSATKTFQALTEDGRRALFADYLPIEKAPA